MHSLHPFYRTPYSPSRAQAVAAQRAKRAQWLPDESYDDDDYSHDLFPPRERAYLDAHRHQVLREQERQRREVECRKRAEEERRWQQELDKRQKEDEVARHKLQEEKQRRRQTQVPDPLCCDWPRANLGQDPGPRSRPGSPAHRIPIFDGTASPSPEQAPSYENKTQQEAVSKIQHCFRIHRSLQSIKDISSQFETLRNGFIYPSIVTFHDPHPSSTHTIDAPSTSSNDVNPDSVSHFPKLAYNSTNYNLHAYNDSLDNLLVKLDGVESWGDPDVRTKRRSVVKSIEQEQGRVEQFCRDTWLKHQNAQENKEMPDTVQ